MLLIILLGLVSISLADDPVRVAVVDTGLDINDPRFKSYLCQSGHRDFTGIGLNDNNGHGTHIAGLIKHHAKGRNFCMIIIKYSDKRSNMDDYLAALEYATTLPVSYINLSLSGMEPSVSEENLISSNPNITFIVAAGNNGKNLSVEKYYPGGYNFNNVITVGAITQTGKQHKGSNYGSDVDVWEVGVNVESEVPCKSYTCVGRKTGTSQAAAIVTGKRIYGK